MEQRKALFVDADRLSLDIYASRFSTAGYESATADSSEAALTMVRGGYAPDIIFVEASMPGMDGIELLEALRSEGLAPDAAIVFLANHADAVRVSRAHELGADGYIVKASAIPSEIVAEADKIYKHKRRARRT